MIYYVYEHWRPDTNKCFYVGKGKGKRAWQMNGRNKHHKAIVSKLSDFGLCVDVRIIVSNISESAAFEVEKDLILKYGKGNLANLTDGGEGPAGRVVSLETKNKLKLSLTGKIKSAEAKAKLSKKQQELKIWNGKKHSLESKIKMSDAKKGKTSPRRGCKLSEETKNKIRQANLGKKASKETKDKMSRSTKIWWQNAGN